MIITWSSHDYHIVIAHHSTEVVACVPSWLDLQGHSKLSLWVPELLSILLPGFYQDDGKETSLAVKGWTFCIIPEWLIRLLSRWYHIYMVKFITLLRNIDAATIHTQPLLNLWRCYNYEIHCDSDQVQWLFKVPWLPSKYNTLHTVHMTTHPLLPPSPNPPTLILTNSLTIQ